MSALILSNFVALLLILDALLITAIRLFVIVLSSIILGLEIVSGGVGTFLLFNLLTQKTISMKGYSDKVLPIIGLAGILVTACTQIYLVMERKKFKNTFVIVLSKNIGQVMSNLSCSSPQRIQDKMDPSRFM